MSGVCRLPLKGRLLTFSPIIFLGYRGVNGGEAEQVAGQPCRI